jgi:uncharacterized protein (DUF1330 family)
MAAYIIVRMHVTDMEQYKEYAKAAPGVVAQYGGRVIVRGGETVTLEGPEEKDRIVVLEFPSLDRARAFYGSEEYTAAVKLRAGAASAQFVAVEGV